MHFVYPISAAVLDQVMDTGVQHADVGLVFPGLDSDPPVHSLQANEADDMVSCGAIDFRHFPSLGVDGDRQSIRRA